MSTTLTIQGTEFNYPGPDATEPGWGPDATGWAIAVTEALNDLVSIDDILQTSFNIANNQSAAANVAGLIFNTASARGGKINYTAYRSTLSNEVAEEGTLSIIYRNTAGSWLISREFVGDAGLTFDITNAGQIQYTSTNLAGTSYSGTLRYRASILQQ